ncbi:MAG: hypothetical protein HY904_00030 [Deltaproteobacteria bacterium]|nr:hypothetical protein [Deltaproteobacteria bacterium]
MKRVTQAGDLRAAVAGKKAVVLFHATWCPFCVNYRPTFVDGVRDLGGWEPVECVMDDESNPLWVDHDIHVVPTLIRFEDGRPTGRANGRLGAGLGRDALPKLLALPG